MDNKCQSQNRNLTSSYSKGQEQSLAGNPVTFVEKKIGKTYNYYTCVAASKNGHCTRVILTLVRVLKVLGDLLGHFSPPSPESGQNSGPESVPGLLEKFLAGSTKSAPNHLAGPTKIPLPKNPPGRVSMELLMQCNFFQCYLVNSICRGGR